MRPEKLTRLVIETAFGTKVHASTTRLNGGRIQIDFIAKDGDRWLRWTSVGTKDECWSDFLTEKAVKYICDRLVWGMLDVRGRSTPCDIERAAKEVDSLVTRQQTLAHVLASNPWRKGLPEGTKERLERLLRAAQMVAITRATIVPEKT